MSRNPHKPPPKPAPGVWGEDKARKADAARQGVIHDIGVELMNSFNRGKTDPSVMAMLGHDTMTGYEFTIERGGAVHTVTVTRDWE